MDGWGPWHEHIERVGAYWDRWHADGRHQRHIIWRAGETHNEPLPD